MKRIGILLMMMLLAVAKSAAQTVEGVVLESVNNESLSYATVRLFEAEKVQAKDAVPVKVMTTDANGRFSIKAPKEGDYVLSITYFGFEPKMMRMPLKAGEQRELGNVGMKEAAKMMKTATVAAQRLLVKAEIDKMTYEMKDDPDAQSSSLLDMLRKVPMVTVDGEDKIQVNGSASFKVYVNGKPNQMLSANPSMIMKNFPAAMVKRVEVVTNPGAKYDAEGVAGVLNIVTEDDAQTSGWTVTPTLSGGNKHQMGSVAAMFQTGRLTLSANYGIGHNHNGGINAYSVMHNYNDANSHLFRSSSKNDNEGIFQFGSLDASYEFDKKNLLSVSMGLNGYNGKVTGDTRTDLFTKAWYDANATAYGDLHKDELPTSVVGDLYGHSLRNDQRVKNFSLNTAVDYQHTFAKEGQNLTLSYRLTYNPTRNKLENIYTGFTPSPLQPTMPDGLFDQRSDPRNRSNEHTFQADYTHPFGQGGKDGTLSVGAKYILRLNNTNSLVETSKYTDFDNKPEFAVDPALSIEYNHRGDVKAAYAEYLYNVGKVGMQAGVRYEHYHMSARYPKDPASNFSTNIGDVVPSLTVSYSLKPTMMLKAGYNARIGRPDITMLSPYRENKSAEVVTYGNPELESERAHNFNATFTTFSQKFTLNTSLTYSLSNNGLTPYSFMENGRHHTTYGDYAHNRTLALSVFMNWMFTKTTSLNVNATGEYKHLYAHELPHLDTDQKGFHGNLFAGLVQQLPWKLRAQLWAGGSTRDVTLMGRGPGFYFYSLNLSRTFLKEDRLTVTLSAANFIGGRRTFAQTQDTPLYFSHGYARMNLTNISASIQWRLGSLTTKVKKTNRTIKNDDIIQGQQDDQTGGAQGGNGMGQM